MPILTYSGSVGSSIGLNITRSVTMYANESPSNAIATGSVTAHIYLSTNAYSKLYNIAVEVNGYSGNAYVKFSSDNYSGKWVDVHIPVDASFNVNGVDTMLVWDNSNYSDKVYIRPATHSIDIEYVQPTDPLPPSNVTLNGIAGDIYVLPGDNETLAWSGAQNGFSNPINSYSVFQDGLLWKNVDTSTTMVFVHAPSSGGIYHTYSIVSNANYGSSGQSVSRKVYAYTNCTTPTSIVTTQSTADVGTSVKLSWSGAEGGSYNSIKSYEVWRSSSPNSDFKLLKTVATSSGSGSLDVVTPDSMGATYYYKISTIGQRACTPLSSATASLSATVYTACTPPNRIALNSTHVRPGVSTTLFWGGAQNGTNNKITQYKIIRGTSVLATVSAETTEYDVKGNNSEGGTYSFSVIAVGSYSDSSPSVAITLYTYGLVTAPTEVALSSTQPVAGASVTLSWSGAGSGVFNPITGYEIWKASSLDDTSFVHWKTVNTGATSGSLAFAAPSSMGAAEYYNIRTKSKLNDSTFTKSVHLITLIFSNCTPPDSISLSSRIANPGASVTLSWSGASSGTNASIAGYEVWRSTTSSGHYHLLTSSVSTSLDVFPNTDQGSAYYYKIKTKSSPADHDSVLSNDVSLVTNTYPQTPIIKAPGTGWSTYNSRPRLMVTVSDDPDKISQNLNVPGYDVSSHGPLIAGQRIILRKVIPIKKTGLQSVSVCSVDSLGGRSDVASTTFSYFPKEYTDEEIVSGLTPIRAAHMNELRSALDNVCDYYGIPHTRWQETVESGVTCTLGWTGHVAEIQSTIVRIADYVNSWDTASSALDIILPIFRTAQVPSADVVMQLRDIVTVL